jgi:hypothetical protein
VRAPRELHVAARRLPLEVSFTWAFHAREVRFERLADAGRMPLFPETFSFHLDRHDPLELQLQLEDLWTDPRRIGEGATRRDGQEIVRSILAGAPGYIEALLAEVVRDERLSPEACVRIHGDAVVLANILARFLREKELDVHPETRFARFHLRRLVWRAARVLVGTRVSARHLDAWLVEPGRRISGPTSERTLLQTLADGTDEQVESLLLSVAERAFHRWLGDTCLDPSNEAFESEGSPFGSREDEVLAVVSVDPERRLRRVAHLSPFLRRQGSRDCLRLLRALEVWFLRQYDVPRAAAVIRHEENLVRGRTRFRGLLSWHSTATYSVALGFLMAPFVGASVAYQRAPLVFDVAASGVTICVIGAVLWYLVVRFLWQKDLAFFHSAVPRIGAGIIVGYLPVFLIDEIWDLARREWFPLGVTMALMGTTTFLYLYVEVRNHIHDRHEAFSRARRIFLLGIVQAFALGLIVTTLLGQFMVERDWSDEIAQATLEAPLHPGEGQASLDEIRAATPPVVGELPRILGFDHLYVYPTAVLLMTFFSFFIGIFLQLLWEDLPITEPL